ncbi:hypothetical protein ECTW09195_5098, partial [Escherichia coli TW09195]
RVRMKASKNIIQEFYKHWRYGNMYYIDCVCIAYG